MICQTKRPVFTWEREKINQSPPHNTTTLKSKQYIHIVDIFGSFRYSNTSMTIYPERRDHGNSSFSPKWATEMKLNLQKLKPERRPKP